MQLDVGSEPTFRVAHMICTVNYGISCPDMIFFLVHDFFLVNFGPVPDGQTDRKQLPRANRALAQVG